MIQWTATIEHETVEDPCAPPDGATVHTQTRHVYLGLTPIEEYRQVDCPAPTPDIDWALAREFLWGDRFPEPLALIDWTEAGDEPAGVAEKLYYLRDVLGSVVGLATPELQGVAGVQSKLVERYVYDPYGKTYIEAWSATQPPGGDCDPAPGGGYSCRVSQSEFGNPFLWTGQRYDPGVGLYHFLFRSYSPELGRWMQRDPIGYVDGVSLYGYVQSRPIDATDPFGLDDIGACDPNRPPSDPCALANLLEDMAREMDQDLDELRDLRKEKEAQLHRAQNAVAELANQAQDFLRNLIGKVKKRVGVSDVLDLPGLLKEVQRLHDAALDGQLNAELRGRSQYLAKALTAALAVLEQAKAEFNEAAGKYSRALVARLNLEAELIAAKRGCLASKSGPPPSTPGCREKPRCVGTNGTSGGA